MKTWDLGFQFSLAGRQSWNMGLWHLQGAVKDSSFPSSKSNNTDNVVLSDIFCNPPPPQWPYHSRSERCAVSFKIQPCYGVGRNFVSSLFRLAFKVGWLPILVRVYSPHVNPVLRWLLFPLFIPGRSDCIKSCYTAQQMLCWSHIQGWEIKAFKVKVRKTCP